MTNPEQRQPTLEYLRNDQNIFDQPSFFYLNTFAVENNIPLLVLRRSTFLIANKISFSRDEPYDSDVEFRKFLNMTDEQKRAFFAQKIFHIFNGKRSDLLKRKDLDNPSISLKELIDKQSDVLHFLINTADAKKTILFTLHICRRVIQ